MRLLFPLILVVTIRDLCAENSEYHGNGDNSSSINYTYNDGDAKIHTEIHDTLQHYQKCRNDNEWSCDKNCRLEFFMETKKCRNPNPSDSCFDIPINYSYSRDFHLLRFPRELAVISRYPRCWSHLAPLICATIYRPCSTHSFIERDDQGKVKNGSIELWQLLSTVPCESVRQACSTVVSEDLLSTYTHCENPKHSQSSEPARLNRTLYSKSCHFVPDQLPISVKRGTCAWPLLSTQSDYIHRDSSPVIDSCFLPCRSPLVSQSLASRFRFARFIICIIFTAVFVVEPIYLSRISNTCAISPQNFCVSHAMISFSVHLLVWGVPVFDYFFSLSECSVDGVSRRYATTHSVFEWCSVQSFALYASITAAFAWLFALYIITMFPQTLIRHLFSARLNHLNKRSFLVLSIYGFSSFLAILVNNMRENDGVTGVCYSGLITSSKYFVSMAPLLCLLILFVCLGIFVHFRKGELQKAVAKQGATFALNEAEENERVLRCRTLKRDGHITEYACTSSGCEQRESGVAVGLVIPTEVNEGEALKEVSDQDIRTENRRRLHTDFASYYTYSLSNWWSVVSFGFATLFLISAPAIHYRYTGLASNDHEARSIVDYINCGTAHAIANYSIEWKADSAWPSPLTRDVTWCSLPLEEAQARLEGILVVFVLLPAIPFLVLFVAFVVELSENGGVAQAHNNHDCDKDLSRIRNGTENLQLLTVEKRQFCEKPFSHSGSCGGVRLQEAYTSEAHASSLATIADRSLSNVLDEIVADDEDPVKPSASDDQNGCTIGAETAECHGPWEIINQLRSELVFQQSMLVNDGAAWNICLHYMRKLEQNLSQLNTQMSTTTAVAQGFRSLAEELSHILPTISDHAIQLSRWMHSVQNACAKLEHILHSTSRNNVFYTCFESQDICLQQNLFALDTYLRDSQAVDSFPQGASPATPEVMSQKVISTTGYATAGQTVSSHAQGEQHSSLTEQAASLAVPSRQYSDQPGSSQQLWHIVQNRSATASAVNHSSNNAFTECVQSSGSSEPLSRAHQAQRTPRISAYTASYAATPRGFFSRLTLPELLIRIEQIRNICAGDILYPQELIYMLLASGDIIYGSNQQQNGLHHYPLEQMPELFGTSVPAIDARVGVQTFLSHMRRRALTVVGAVGYHFSQAPHRGTDYTPPVLPPLGLYRSENELILRRVLGDRDDILPFLRDFLREYNFGRGPINPRPDLKFATAFRNYLCMVAAREGFIHEDPEEHVPDPLPPPELPNDESAEAHDRSSEAYPSSPAQ